MKRKTKKNRLRDRKREREYRWGRGDVTKKKSGEYFLSLAGGENKGTSEKGGGWRREGRRGPRVVSFTRAVRDVLFRENDDKRLDTRETRECRPVSAVKNDVALGHVREKRGEKVLIERQCVLIACLERMKLYFSAERHSRGIVCGRTVRRKSSKINESSH